ncbi:hypothetical protein CRENBAI_017095 [Crenichthys baileyi]|uniref:Uncharacterized protein n=1 Tax=Crenichthys baileyi TaxID=28760 RepID=A0AAV9SIC6_9TELE
MPHYPVSSHRIQEKKNVRTNPALSCWLEISQAETTESCNISEVLTLRHISFHCSEFMVYYKILQHQMFEQLWQIGAITLQTSLDFSGCQLKTNMFLMFVMYNRKKLMLNLSVLLKRGFQFLFVAQLE